MDRFWPAAALEKVAAQFTPGIGPLFFAGDEVNLRFDIETVSHRTNRLYLKEDGFALYAEIQLLDTPNGRRLQQLIDLNRAAFDAVITGATNAYDEVEPESLTYVYIAAYDVPGKPARPSR
jgi:hypothetical protein